MGLDAIFQEYESYPKAITLNKMWFILCVIIDRLLDTLIGDIQGLEAVSIFGLLRIVPMCTAKY